MAERIQHIDSYHFVSPDVEGNINPNPPEDKKGARSGYTPSSEDRARLSQNEGYMKALGYQSDDYMQSLDGKIVYIRQSAYEQKSQDKGDREKVERVLQSVIRDLFPSMEQQEFERYIKQSLELPLPEELLRPYQHEGFNGIGAEVEYLEDLIRLKYASMSDEEYLAHQRASRMQSLRKELGPGGP